MIYRFAITLFIDFTIGVYYSEQNNAVVFTTEMSFL